MTPNKLPPLPIRWADFWLDRGNRDAAHDVSAFELAERYAYACIEALRQSQSLPAGAVAGLVGKWRDSSAFETDGYSILHRCATELEQAIQADAREKGGAVVTEEMVWRAVNANHGSARVGNLIDDTDPFAVMRTGLVAALATQPAQASEAVSDAARLDFMVHRGANIDCYKGKWSEPTVYRVTAFGNILTDWCQSYREAIDTALATSSQETASE